MNAISNDSRPPARMRRNSSRPSGPSPPSRDGSCAAGSDDGDEFVAVLQRAPYQIDMTTLDVVLERAQRDGGVIAGLNTYLLDRAAVGIVSVRVKQRPTDSHMSLSWMPSRQLKDLSTTPSLTTREWSSMHPLDWDEAKKRAFLLDAWARVVRALREEEDGATLRATA
jgi:hypothetical protein